MLRKELPVREKPSFGVLQVRGKSLDVGALAQKILRKGEKDIEHTALQVFSEPPPGHENGVLLTHTQVQRMFDVTGMTIFTWRKRYGMPYMTLQGGKRPPVRYDEGAVLAWAQLHEKKVMKHDYRDWD